MQIYDINGDAIGLFTGLEEKVSSEVNMVPILEFTIPLNIGKYFHLECECALETGESFIIKEKSKLDQHYEIVAKGNISVLQEKIVKDYYFKDKTVKEIAESLLIGTWWEFETTGEQPLVTISGKIKTAYLVIMDAIEQAGFEYKIDTKTKTITAGQKIGEDRGTFFSTELNIRSIRHSENSYSLVTHLIPKGKDGLGIESVNDGVPWIITKPDYVGKPIYGTWEDNRFTDPLNLKKAAEKKAAQYANPHKNYEIDAVNLQKISPAYSLFKYDVGDTVTVIDTYNGTREEHRILSKQIYLNDHFKDTLVLGNKLLEVPVPADEVSINANSNLNNNGSPNSETVVSSNKLIFNNNNLEYKYWENVYEANSPNKFFSGIGLAQETTTEAGGIRAGLSVPGSIETGTGHFRGVVVTPDVILDGKSLSVSLKDLAAGIKTPDLSAYLKTKDAAALYQPKGDYILKTDAVSVDRLTEQNLKTSLTLSGFRDTDGLINQKLTANGDILTIDNTGSFGILNIWSKTMTLYGASSITLASPRISMQGTISGIQGFDGGLFSPDILIRTFYNINGGVTFFTNQPKETDVGGGPLLGSESGIGFSSTGMVVTVKGMKYDFDEIIKKVVTEYGIGTI